MKLDEYLSHPIVRALFYGATGTAKTTLLGLMAEHDHFSPMYIFDFDLRLQGVRPTLSQKALGNIEFDPYTDGKLAGSSISAAEMKLKQFEDMKDQLPYRTVGLDSFTFMSKAALTRVMVINGKTATDTPEQRHYMLQQKLIENFIQRLKALPCNIVITCHNGHLQDQVTGRIFNSIDATGRLKNDIPGHFNEVWHTEASQDPVKGTMSYIVRCKSGGGFDARTSMKSLGAIEQQQDVWRKVVAEIAASAK